MSEPIFPNPSKTANMLRDTMPELSDRADQGASGLNEGWHQLRDSVLQQLDNLSRSLPQAMQEGRYDDVAAGMGYLHEVVVLGERAKTFMRYYEATHRNDMWQDPDSIQLKQDFEQGVRQVDAARKRVGSALGEVVDQLGTDGLFAARSDTIVISYLLNREYNAMQMRPPMGESLPDDPPHVQAHAAALKQSQEIFNRIQNEGVSYSEFKDIAAKALGDKFIAEDGWYKAAGGTADSPLAAASEHMGVSENVVRDILSELPNGLEGARFQSVHVPVMFSWEEAQILVRDALRDFNPAMGEIAERAFSEGWIDAQPAGKQKNGANFSDEGVAQRFWKDGHPYIVMEFGNLGGGTVGNMMTLSHEMGHAIAQYLEGASVEERARLGIQDLDGVIMPSRLRNGAVHETFAHTSEKIVGEHMMRQLDGLKGAAVARELELHYINQVRLNMYLSPELELRDLAIQNGGLTGDNIEAAYTRAGKAAENTLNGKLMTKRDHVLSNVKNSSQLFLDEPLYNAHYVMAETGSRAIMQALREAGPEERAQIQERMLDMMARGSGNNVGWQNFMEGMGIDVTAPDFAERAMAFRARPDDVERMKPVRLAADEGAPKPDLTSIAPLVRQVDEPLQLEQQMQRFSRIADALAAQSEGKPEAAGKAPDALPGDLKAPQMQANTPKPDPSSRKR